MLGLRNAFCAGVRASTVGACFGAIVSLAEQLMLHLSGFFKQPIFLVERISGFCLTVAFFAALSMVTASLGWSVGALRGPVMARRVMLVPFTIAIVLAITFHGAALTSRLLSGSSLTMHSVRWVLLSWGNVSHVTDTSMNEYVKYIVGMVVALIASGVGVSLALRWAEREPLRVGKAETGSACLLLVVALVAIVVPLPIRVARATVKTSAEMAFLVSAGPPRRADRFEGTVFLELTDASLGGPKRSEAANWFLDAQDALEGLNEKPNVLLIMLETVGENHVGFLGYDRHEVTPNLDRMAKQSVVFERAYTTATHSNYAQMAVLSSLFPRRGNSLDVYSRLDYPRVLLHDLTVPLGYTAATISAQDESWQGMLRFQSTGTQVHYRHALDRKDQLEAGEEEVPRDDLTATEAISWLDARPQDKPFSLYLNFQTTHFPYAIPKGAPRPFRPSEPHGTFSYVLWQRDELDTIINRYDNSLRYVDEQIGRIYDALVERELLDDTIIVVVADHGEMFFDHDLVTHGRTLYEPEARVPFLIHYPHGMEPRRVPDAVSTLDVVPTILDLMGVAPHPSQQGESVAWVDAPGGGARQSAVFMNIQGWKLYDGIVCMPYKLVFDPDTDESALYDLVNDPDESRDIAQSHKETVIALEEVLLAQLDAQERYHADDKDGAILRADRFAPNMLSCPGQSATH